MVIAYHGKGHFAIFDNCPERLAYTQPVCFFFILSGFILSYVHRDISTLALKKDCWIKRIARIWPLHMVVNILRLFLFPKYLLTFPGPANSTLVMLTNIFMLHAWVPLFQFFFSYNAPSWSISTEFFFYLCFPFILPLVVKRPILSTVAAFAILFVFGATCNYFHLPEINEQGIDMRGILYIFPLPRIFEFVAGMAMARLYISRGEKWKLGLWQATIAEIFAVILTCVLMIWTRPLAAIIAEHTFTGEAGRYWLINTGVPMLGFCLVIFLMAKVSGLISKLIALPFFVLLGELSYSIYLLHHPLLCFHGLYFSQYRSTEAFILFSAVMLVLSHFCFKYLEAPIRRFMISEGTKRFNPEFAKPTKWNFSKKGLIAPLAELALLAVICLFAFPGLPSISAEKMNALALSGQKLVQNVEFDQNMKLAAVLADTKDPAKIVFLWQALKDFKAIQFLNIQYLDGAGEQIFTQVVRVAPGEPKIKEGTCWKEDIDLYPKYVAKADKLALVIYESATTIKNVSLKGEEASFANPVIVDQGGKRLVFALKK